MKPQVEDYLNVLGWLVEKVPNRSTTMRQHAIAELYLKYVPEDLSKNRHKENWAGYKLFALISTWRSFIFQIATPTTAGTFYFRRLIKVAM